jgi:hypothetical protein
VLRLYVHADSSGGQAQETAVLRSKLIASTALSKTLRIEPALMLLNEVRDPLPVHFGR